MTALSHIRVLELGQVIAGTYGGMLLADLGAEVVKIEPPRGDLGRNPEAAWLHGESGLFLTMNRGKRSVVIDLKQPRGLEVFYDLARKSDLVIDNFRPAVVERAMGRLPHVGFVNAYGLTEASSTIAVLGPDDHRTAYGSDDPSVRVRLGSVGRPLPTLELEIRDPWGAVLPAGETGEIHVRGDQIAGEYVRRIMEWVWSTAP